MVDEMMEGREIESLRIEPGSATWQKRVLQGLLIDRVTGLERAPSANAHATALIEQSLATPRFRFAWADDMRVGTYGLCQSIAREEPHGPIAVVVHIHRFEDVRITLGPKRQERLLRAVAEAIHQSLSEAGAPIRPLIDLDARRSDQAHDRTGVYVLRPHQARFLMLTVGMARSTVYNQLLPDINRRFRAGHGLDDALFFGVPTHLTAGVFPLMEAVWLAAERHKGVHGNLPTESAGTFVGEVLDVWSGVSSLILQVLSVRAALETLARASVQRPDMVDILLGSRMVTSLGVDPNRLKVVGKSLGHVGKRGNAAAFNEQVKAACRQLVLQPLADHAFASWQELPEGEDRLRLGNRIRHLEMVYGVLPSGRR